MSRYQNINATMLQAAELVFKNKWSLYLLLSILCLLCPHQGIGQTAGPAGIGNSDGSHGQPRTILWIDAQEIGVSNGASVSTWADLSGNNHDFISTGANPVFSTGIAGINNQSVVRFTNANSEALEFYSGFGNPTDGIVNNNYTFFWVAARTSEDDQQYVFGGNNGSANRNLYSGWGYPGSDTEPDLCANQWSNDCAADWDVAGSYDTRSLNDFAIVSSYLDNAVGRFLFENGEEVSSTANTTQLTDQDNTKLAFRGGSGDQYADVDIAEVIFFQTNINEAQRIIIENYLSAKYNVALNLNDYYSSTNYLGDITGIGTTDGSVKHAATTGNGGALYIEEANNTLDAANEFVMAGHNELAHGLTTADITTADRARWKRIWYLDKTTAGDVDITMKFSTGEAGFGIPTAAGDYELLFRSGTSGNFTGVTYTSRTINTDNQVEFTVNSAEFGSGYYTLGVPEYKIWYTLISGDWDDPETWTLDPSGGLPNNPDDYTPSTSPTSNIDKVVILSGKTVTVSANNKSNALVEVEGRLNLGTTSGHSWATVNGSGRIILENADFPSGDATHFVSRGQGEGTVVFKGSSFSSSTDHEFYNLEIELDNNTETFELVNDLTLNGNLKVSKGIFQINNNSSTGVLNINVNDDVLVESNGKIRVGTGDTYTTNSMYHQFMVGGNFTNYGSVELTNRGAANYSTDDTGGAVELIFNSDNSNQYLQCNNNTILNQLTIDKGIDDTYILEVTASSPTNFMLYGRNSGEVSGSSGSRDGNKALRLLAGTVKLGTNIVIDVLAQDYSYDIDSDARLWLNGASVTIPNGTSNNWLAIYGKLQITGNSSFTEQTDFGTILREQGAFMVESGSVEINNFRTSTWGISGDHVGSYIQSGGTVILTNEGSNNDYASFHLPYPTNVFQMSGGTLIIEDQGDGGAGDDFAVVMNCSPGNYKVTGGTVIINMKYDVPYKINSTVPFWDFIVRNSVDADQTLTISEFVENPGDEPDDSNDDLLT